MTITIGNPAVAITDNQRKQIIRELGVTDSSMTAAQLATDASAGDLVQYTTYIASDTGVRYLATAANTLVVKLHTQNI